MSKKVTISLTLSEVSWSEMINAVESKIRLIERGDYGDGVEDDDADNVRWLANLNAVFEKLQDALHSKRIDW